MKIALIEWLARVLGNPAPPPNARDVAEHDKTVDDVETNAPPRKKKALRRAPERK